MKVTKDGFNMFRNFIHINYKEYSNQSIDTYDKYTDYCLMKIFMATKQYEYNSASGTDKEAN